MEQASRRLRTEQATPGWLTGLLIGTGLLTVLAAGGALAADAPATKDEPDLSGVWLLDESASDDIEAELQKLMAEGRSHRGAGERGGKGGGRSGMDGMRGGGERGGNGGSASASGGDPASQRRLGEGFSMLLITHQDDSFEVVDATDRVWITSIDGKPTVQQNEYGTATGVVSWDDRTLVENWDIDERLDLTRRYTLAPEGNGLVVEITIESSRVDTNATARLVYKQP